MITPTRTDVDRAATRQRRSWPLVALVLLGACLILLRVVSGEPVWRFAWLAVGVLVTAGSAALWWREGRAGGWAALIFGSIGLAAGIGIGIRRLSVAIDLQSVVALFALMLGVALVGAGIHRIVDGLSPLPAVASGALLLVFVAVWVWTLVPAIVATNVPDLSHESLTAADFGIDAREVTFTTADGVELWGWYAPPPSGKVVVLRHGSGSTATDVLPHARVLVENGYGVLIADARGHGLSGGRAMDFGWYGTLDIEAAVSFLAEQPEVDLDGIAVVGMSMGGEEAIGAAASDERIAAVVAEGATARTDADKAWLVDEYGLRGWLQTKLEWVQYEVTDMLTDADEPESLATSARRASPRPILMITGGEAPDEAHAAEYISGGTGNVSIWTVPHAGHTQGLAVAPEEWESRVVEFLNQAMGDR